MLDVSEGKMIRVYYRVARMVMAGTLSTAAGMREGLGFAGSGRAVGSGCLCSS